MPGRSNWRGFSFSLLSCWRHTQYSRSFVDLAILVMMYRLVSIHSFNNRRKLLKTFDRLEMLVMRYAITTVWVVLLSAVPTDREASQQ